MRARTSIHGTNIRSVEPTASSDPLNLDRICSWQEEMHHAVRRRESLPPAACGAIAQLLERFLEDETADDGRADEVRAAIALLIVASHRNPRFGGDQIDAATPDRQEERAETGRELASCAASDGERRAASPVSLLGRPSWDGRS